MEEKTMKPENIEAMKERTVELMQRMKIRDRQLVYCYAYSLIVAGKHKGDPNFVREPLPPSDVLHLRVRNLLRDATEKEAKYIFFWAWAKRMEEKRKE
jgi:hypothetical protein